MPYNQPIQRRLVAAVTKEYEQRGQVAPQQTSQEQTPVMLPTVFFGFYEPDYGSVPIEPGTGIRVWHFRPSTLSYANALKQIYRNKIKLEVDIAPPNWDNGEDLYALTPAKAHRICQFYSRSNSFYFAHVNAALPEGYDGENIKQYYNYVDINGVATNDEENAYAEIRFGTPIVNNYAVAFCKRIEKEGLTIEEVDEEIDTKLTGKEFTLQYVSAVSFAVSSDGYLTIQTTRPSKTIYAP